MPDGVKENVDYTLTVGANPAVGYDDNGTVSTKYRHTVTVVNPQVKYSTLQLGDVDGDGEVTMSDVLMVYNFAMGDLNPSAEQILAADVDGDEEITMSDVLLIYNYSMGDISKFPVE